MKEDKEELKKQIQTYWSENVPGLAETMKEFELGTVDFYESVDSYRYRNESYIPPLLDSVVEKGKKVLYPDLWFNILCSSPGGETMNEEGSKVSKDVVIAVTPSFY